MKMRTAAYWHDTLLTSLWRHESYPGLLVPHFYILVSTIMDSEVGEIDILKFCLRMDVSSTCIYWAYSGDTEDNIFLYILLTEQKVGIRYCLP